MEKTTDLWFSSWLTFKGYKLNSQNVLSRGRCEFVFEISKEDYKKERMDFFRSDLSKIKSIMENLKDLAY